SFLAFSASIDLVSEMLRMDDMNAGLPRREPLNVRAEPGHDLLETDVFDVTKAVRTKKRGHASWLETAGPGFRFLQLSGPLRYDLSHLSWQCLGRFHVVEHHLRVLD